MKLRALALVLGISVVALTAGVRLVVGEHAMPIVVEGPKVAGIELPTAQTAKALLNDATHFSELVDVVPGHGRVDAYVAYPERGGKSPVVLVTARGEGMSDWARAVGAQVARSGFIAVVPDDASDAILGQDSAARQYVTTLSASNGTIATLDFYADADGRRQIATSVESPGLDDRMASFTAAGHGWASALAFLAEQTNNRFVPNPHAHMDHAALEGAAQEPGRGARGEGRGGAGGRPPGGGLNEKRDDLPANWVMAKKTVAQTPRKNEWVDIPVGSAKLHTWVVYPPGNDKVGAVVVLHGATGPSDSIRAVGDQLAHDGFIALVVDMTSGQGPNGGNFDSIPFPDDVMMAGGRVGRDGTMARIKAAAEYGAKLPRSNGKVATLGFCGGGANSFRSAAEVPGLNAAVVYYGAPPEPATLANVKAPVIAFHGENDVRLTEMVAPAAAEMKRLGKVYEPHIYPRTTHSFLMFQDLGDNFLSTNDSWPKAIAFLKMYLM
jgi:carboxymethylenebutenolidase